ncbi:ABC transporter ATP-binding protein [Pseudorhodoplanes sinuspersici]|uniref:ABC transporter ATP-binding protein n=1 Tax=Pseudorhodoplanes sinuspersici TaxID=1235591 RepID=A0A1W6ZZR9_9HYPH|nr:ABC transporter ATP-binding protein [Pseudorhodoplanes sinuspersici]ARQ02621.1 ABC transporter ATP-binding protein [Pseudorhodoplanes sinuspersici]RKE74485.1 nucleoside ABC transporter ATP-binding protein [Pseudorhodoplanes sinuspersici]
MQQVLTPPALELVGIRKTFDGFVALDNAMFAAQRGEVHALLGENGAGKSSLMNVACGLYTPEVGRVMIDGVDVMLSGPRDASARGIGMVHQHFKLVRPFTVAENVLLANPRGRFGKGIREISDDIRRRSDDLGFKIDPDRRVDDLSVAEQQRTEILKVLIGGARILILDEPTAVLTDQEAERLLTTVRSIARSGATVVLVTHKLADVKTYADRVTIMRGGSTIATVDPATKSREELTKLTVGTNLPSPARSADTFGRRRIEVMNLRCARADGHVALEDATFHVRSGEIYGVAGVSGNGQSELADVLMGVRTPLSGIIQIEETGEALKMVTPRGMRARGAAFIPADRYGLALASTLPVLDNFTVGAITGGRYGSWLRLRTKAMRTDAETAIADFDVQGVRSLAQKAALLSGGNAQKLVIAREFSNAPDIIIAHSPSRGLDARATSAVHARLAAARARQAAVLLISEDLDEVLALSDRIGVMTRGRIVAEFEAPANRQQVGQAMVDHV